MHWLAAYHANVYPVPPSVLKWALGIIYNTMLSSMQAVGRNIEQQEGDNFFEVTLQNNPNWSQSYMQNSNKKDPAKPGLTQNNLWRPIGYTKHMHPLHLISAQFWNLLLKTSRLLFLFFIW